MKDADGSTAPRGTQEVNNYTEEVTVDLDAAGKVAPVGQPRRLGAPRHLGPLRRALGAAELSGGLTFSSAAVVPQLQHLHRRRVLGPRAAHPAGRLGRQGALQRPAE
jgi:hypothetical protein